DGPAFHERLRRERPGLAARTVFITGDVVSTSGRTSASRQPVLTKPFAFEKLEETLVALMRRSPRRRSGRDLSHRHGTPHVATLCPIRLSKRGAHADDVSQTYDRIPPRGAESVSAFLALARRDGDRHRHSGAPLSRRHPHARLEQLAVSRRRDLAGRDLPDRHAHGASRELSGPSVSVARAAVRA